METVLDFITTGGLRFDLLGRLVLAAVLGGLVGLEREASGKPAGLRTNVLICVGAALLADLSIYFQSFVQTDLVRADPARIAAQVVSGMGFLGAGTIIQARGSVTGLTTAATLWVVAAIGLAVGGGFHVAAIGSTVLVLVVLFPLGLLEKRLAARGSYRTVRVIVQAGGPSVGAIQQRLEEAGLEVRFQEVTREREEDRVLMFFRARGNPSIVAEARDGLLEMDAVRSFSLISEK